MLTLKKFKLNKKGFTLAELLIVIAIIAILVAIAIPVFTGQLNKAKAGTDLANLRSAYAVAQVELLNNGSSYSTKADAIKAAEDAIKAALPEVVSQYGKAEEGIKITEVTATGTGKAISYTVDIKKMEIGGISYTTLLNVAGGTLPTTSPAA